MFEVLALSTAVQLSLGIGYLAYATAYAGYRRHHDTRDAIFITLVFAGIASAIYAFALPLGSIWGGVIAAMSALALASLWRVAGQPAWLWVMAATGVHREDGITSSWEALVQTRRKVGQFSVQTKAGRVLYLNDRRTYNGSAWNGLYLGGDGSVIMAVEEEEMSDGTTEVRDAVTSDWGIRLTYIPADEIARVNIRLE